jgi:eukaryotic-like serine/threonine-protein kinase
MTTRRDDRIDELFEQALLRPPGERSVWLSAACGNDAALREEVAELLEAHALDRGILDRPPPRPAGSGAADRRIGAYRVVRELGRGGMGVVYLAERDDGQFQRRVAVKLLRASPDAEELHRRFVAERQILASLVHPHIAQLLDGGVTDGRLPYLVMEYVEGMPITDYCDRQRLTLNERLRLFMDVCSAVHHAHQNLVIHRDLKPSNIMVTEEGRVKLLDFGIAKLLNPGMSAVAVPVTRMDLRIMTPEYASPEQVRGDPLSTASDVYALGVVLYELLAGRRPYRLASTAPAELTRVVCETDPEAPSLAVARAEPDAPSLAAVSERRHTSPERLRSQLRGDLDAIIAMALRKEPGRRYASAALLAQDVGRHLEGRVVQAHRDTRAYRARKFLRRHRAQVAAGILVALSLVIGAGVALWQAREASEQRDLARSAAALADVERRKSDEVANFLFGLFEASDPFAAPLDSLSARTLLERGRARVDMLGGEPLVQARMLEVLARVYRGFGEYERARDMLERSLAHRRAEQGDTHLEVAQTRYALSEMYRRIGRYPEALAEAHAALDVQRALLGPDHPETASTLFQLAAYYVYVADLRRSAELAEEGLRVRERALGPTDTLVADALIKVAGASRRLGDYDDAERRIRQALQILEHSVGTRHTLYADALMNLGYVLEDDRQRPEEALAVFRQALDIRRELLGPRHIQAIFPLGNISGVLAKLGEGDEAIALSRQFLLDLSTLLGERHPSVAEARGHFGLLLMRLGRGEEAEAQGRDALERMRRAFGYQHSAVGWQLGNLAHILVANGKLEEAEQTMRSALEIRRDATPGGQESPMLGRLTSDLGAIVARRGRHAEAESLLLAGHAMIRRHVPASHHDAQHTRRLLADFYAEIGRPEEAAKYRN